MAQYEGPVGYLVIALQSDPCREKKAHHCRWQMEPLWDGPCFMALLIHSREEAAEQQRCSLAAQAAAGALGEGCQVLSQGWGRGRDRQ